ncbi:S1C family serine protease [Sporichthya polymorpha]|uniref:S1C family serine protease n=1 Tax=Sporichthya polymorpha TaxID=35751 RepID=UPI000382F1A8|nr:trypsin-like peptidase domain-containing protein [Sporichthya polymorpha]
MSDERGGTFPPNNPPSEDSWASGAVYGQSSYGTDDSAAGPYGTQPVYGAYTPPASTPPPSSWDYGYSPPAADPAPAAGSGWPTQPPVYTPAPEPRRNYGALAAIAVVAALIGGAVGGTIASSDDGPSPAISSLSTNANGEVKPVAAAPQGTIEQVAAKVLPSVVSIDVFQGAGLGSGSGVVISSDGLILTNNHVAGQGQLSVVFSDGRSVRARLVKADPSTDLAVIKAEGVTDAVPITFGSSGDLRVGQEVVAIGAPLGLAGTVTTGIVSALNRPVIPQEGQGGDDSVIDGIQTDAPINPGNSGGALVDLNGNLIGITSAIASLGSAFGGQSGSIGLGFAIPIDQAKIIAEQLAKGQTVKHALLGVQVTSSTNATQRGALIRAVTPGGAAEKAGLRSGDVVTRMDSRVISDEAALVAGVRSQQPGTKVKLTYVRDGETRTADVTLGSD